MGKSGDNDPMKNWKKDETCKIEETDEEWDKDLGIPKEKLGGKSFSEALDEVLDISYEAEQIEKRINEKEELKDIQVPDIVYEKILSQISKIDTDKSDDIMYSANYSGEVSVAEEELEAPSIIQFPPKEKRKIRRFPRKSMFFASALCVMFMVFGMNSIGTKDYEINSEETNNGGSLDEKIDRDGNKIVGMTKEKTAFQEVREQIGVEPCKPQYLPEGMKFDKLEIDQITKNAALYYVSQNDKVSMYMQSNIIEISSNNQVDGFHIQNVPLELYNLSLEIKQVNNENGKPQYTVSFDYNKTKYTITSQINLEEFVKIVENLIFS